MFGIPIPPALLKYLIGALAIIGVLAGVYFKGRHDVNVAWDAEKAANKAKVVTVTAAQKEVTLKTTVEYIAKVKVIKEKGDAVIQYVDRIITAKDEESCKMTENIIAAHNAAADNVDSDMHNSASSSVPEVKEPTK